MSHLSHTCRHCGGDPTAPNHARRCDGRQGRLEFEALLDEPVEADESIWEDRERFPPWTGNEPETRATSYAAAGAMVPDVATVREEVYQDIVSQGERGRTDEETQIALGMTGNTQRPRRIELQAAGRVVKTNRTRLTTRGRQAVVWVATKYGGVEF